MSFERTFPESDSAQVTDRVDVDFDWDQQELKPVGAPVGVDGMIRGALLSFAKYVAKDKRTVG